MSDAVKEAQERYVAALDALSEQRRQIEEDLLFSDPNDPQQWDEELKRQRETDPGGARPCLVMDQTSQYVANVAGQVEQRPPSMHAIPAGAGGERRVAEQYDGFFRHIEHASRAQQHYTRALTSAARAGVGYLILRPEYTDRALGYQEPRISSEGDPLRVVFDPWSVELDGSDANFGFLIRPLSHPEYERQFPKKDKTSFGDAEGSMHDARESVLIAEEWRAVNKTTNMVFCVDLTQQNGDVFALPEDEFWTAHQQGRVQAAQDAAGRSSYTDKYRCVKWQMMSGADVLVEATEYPASGIGIIPVYGYVGWSGGRMRYCGIPRRAREAQRAYNYHTSEIRALMSSAPKSPWVVDVRAIKGFEALWDRASVDTRAYLPYHGIDESGQAIAQPARASVAINLQNHVQGAMQAREDIQASIGMYAANIGKQSNAQSGVAYDAQKEQGEASTAHFPSHLAAALAQLGKLCTEMIPRLMDTPRQLRVLGIDMTPGSVMVDPQQKQALRETEAGLSINPKVGKYDVYAIVGSSFATQRQQAQEAYTEMMRANPALTPAIAPLWAQTLDVPHADKLAQVLTAIAPDPVKAILQPNEQENTAALKAERDQLKQALQEALQHAQEAQAELQSKHDEAAAKGDEMAIKEYEAVTKRLQVMGTTLTPEEVQQLTLQTVAQAMRQPDPSEDDTEGRSGDLLQQSGLDTQAPRQDEAQEPAQEESPRPAEPGMDQRLNDLAQGQEHLAQLLEMLIQSMHPTATPEATTGAT